MTVSYAKLREIADHASAAAEESKPTDSGIIYSVMNVTNPRDMRIIGNAETVEGAKALIAADIVCIEEDHENPGYFDAFCANGEIFVIEPR